MKAVIVAAGKGKYAWDKPVSLLEINGKPIIEHQIESLQASGINEIFVVVGYKKELIKSFLGSRVKYIENNDFDHTGSAYSLFLAKDYLSGGFIHVNGDLLFEREILSKLLKSKHRNCFAFDRKYDFSSDMHKVVMIGERIIHHHRQVSEDIANGEVVGPVKISEECAKELFYKIKTKIDKGDKKIPVYDLLSDTAKYLPIHGVNITGLKWSEIDDLKDLQKAINIFGPESNFIAIMFGNPACGKTHTSRNLLDYSSKFNRTVLLSTFNIREELGLVDLHSPSERKIVYQEIINRAKLLMENKGVSIILDGNFNKFERRKLLYDAAKALNYQIFLINCNVSSLNIIQERLEKRKSKSKSLEHAASTMDLYYMIKDTSDSLEVDCNEEISPNIINVNTEKETVFIEKDFDIVNSNNISIILNGIKRGFIKEANGEYLNLTIKAFIFDIGGTLIRTDKAILKALRLALKENGLESFNEEEVINVFGQGNLKNIKTAVESSYFGEDIQEKINLCYKSYKDIFPGKVMGNFEIFPYVLDSLRLLKEKGIKLVVLTGFDKDEAQIFLEKMGLLEYFDLVLSSEEIKEHRPNPQGLLLAMEKLSLKPSECIYVGDAMVDIDFVRSVGVKVVCVKTGAQDNELLIQKKPHFLVDNFQEMISTLF